MHLHRNLPGWIVLVTAVILVTTASQSAVGQLGGFGGGEGITVPPPIRKQPLAEDYVPNDPMPASEQEVRKRLRKIISSDYDETPLEDVLVDLAARLELQILIDRITLTDVGIAIDEPITLNVADISGAATLALVSAPLGLDWFEQDGVLTITTSEIGDEQMPSRIYEVSDLVLARDAEGHLVANFDELVDAIESCAEGRWDGEGVVGEISRLETETTNVLMIRNYFRAFPFIDRMLADIRFIRASDEVVARPPVAPQVIEIEKRLAQPVSVDFDQTPLADVMNHLGKQIDVPVLLDVQALSDVGIAIDEPISLRVSDVSVSTAVDLVLVPLGLSQVIRNEVIQITRMEIVQELLETRVYDVRDLIAYTSLSGATEINSKVLIDLLLDHTEGIWGARYGTGGNAVCLTKPGPPVMVVRQTQRVHREVERIIAELRALQMPREQPAASHTSE